MTEVPKAFAFYVCSFHSVKKNLLKKQSAFLEEAVLCCHFGDTVKTRPSPHW